MLPLRLPPAVAVGLLGICSTRLAVSCYTHPQPSRMRGESANLDFLRSVAVSLVLVFHLLIFFGWTEVAGYSLRSLGLLGVLLFFIHTSLVLMMSLERQRAKFGRPHLFWNFLLRRVFRIYPLSVAVVLGIALFGLPLARLDPGQLLALPLGRWGLAANFLLVQNLLNRPSILGPLWSLPLEMQMYVFLPALFLFARWSRSVKPLLALWLAAVALAAAQPHLHHIPDLALYVPCFVPGIIAYKLWRSPRRWPFYCWPLILGGVTVTALVSVPVARGWVICLVLGLTAPRCVEMSSRWLRRVSHTVAKYSYGLYLTHYFAMWLAFMWLRTAPGPIRWTVFLIALVAVPMILYHGLEAPMIRLGSRAAARLFTPAPAPVPVRAASAE